MRSRAAAGAATSSSATTRKENHRCQYCGSSLLFIQRAFLNRNEKENAAAASAAAASRSTSSKTTATATTTTTTTMSMVPGRPMVTKCAYISFCACFGTYVRLYTDTIGPASNVALQGSFLANSIGSFALGVLASSPDRDTAPDAVYAGLTVGLCGSYTTYSGWNLRVARAALGQVSGAPSGAIVAAVAIVTSLAFFSACFVAGSDLVKGATSRGRRLRLSGLLLGGSGGDSVGAMRGAVGMLGTLYVLLAILLAVDSSWSRRIDWVACMFAPFGALSRFFLSRKLNNRWREGAFPVGTFVANVLGSLVMALVFYGTRNSSSLTTGWNNVALKAFQAGFLGSLTTMSSFVSEVVGHRERHSPSASYVYLAATAIAAQAPVLIIGATLK
ncbi:unnamed protein product [Pylaiella littoralis]